MHDPSSSVGYQDLTDYFPRSNGNRYHFWQFIKASALNNRIFHKLCKKFNAEHSNLLYHTEVCWLSRDKVIQRVFELRDELKEFFRQKGKSQFEQLFGDNIHRHKVAYLVDIFTLLNELNLSLQGQNTTCLKLQEKIRPFQIKLQ